MLAKKLVTTAGVVVGVVAAANLADFIADFVIAWTPQLFTPIPTSLIAACITAPVSYFLISQRNDMQRIKTELSAMLMEKDRAVVESRVRQEEAERALARLRESDGLYRLLADNQTDVISLWDADGKRLYTSPSVERAFGFTVEECMALPGAANAHPDDVSMLTAAIGSIAPGASAKLEYRLVHKDGAAIWVEGTFKRLDDGGGGLLSTTRIIAERRRLQDELVGALDEANAALKVKSDFLANMTHELRTPLNAIIGFSEVLKTSAELEARSARHLDLICDASQTLLGVVNDVLDFSKLEAGAVELEADPFDPMAMAQSTVSLLAGQASARGVGMSARAEGSQDRLVGDGARLRQVLTNLISNAIKFTTRGDIEVTVAQRADGDLRRLRIAVKDSGIGVAPDQIAGIFGRFTQADASVSRKFGGTGLGLAISKRLIEAMGGEIGVDSVVGQGSTFWFEVSLPVAASAGAEADERREPLAVDRALRLLVVDDNAVNRELICTLLEPFELAIETAGDGVEAVEAAARASFDVILMDVQMPNMDGLTATRCIRAAQSPGGPRTPIIAMTANVLPEQVARCLEAGMDDHLGKPISPSTLLQTLARWSAQDPAVEAGGQADQPLSHQDGAGSRSRS